MRTSFKACILTAIVFASSCANTTKTGKNEGNTNKSPATVSLIGYNQVFNYEDSLVHQILGVNFTTEYEIDFIIQFIKKDGSCNIQMKGHAENINKDLETELDEDEDGVAYPSNEFIFENGKCITAVRIAMNDGDKAYVKTQNCANNCYPQTSMLLRLNNKLKN
jgi:hypothetical protein